MSRNIIFYLITCFLSAFFLSCNSNSDTVTKSMNDYSDSVDQIKKEVSAGDTSAYKDLRVVYLEEPLIGLLPWSKLMADKYGYTPAFYDVYYVLLKYEDHDLYSVDSLTNENKKIALTYLVSAARRQQENAIEILDSLKIKWR